MNEEDANRVSGETSVAQSHGAMPASLIVFFFSILPLAIAVLRVARVADFDPQTAGTIVARSSIFGVVVGALLPVLPLLLVAGAAAYVLLPTDFGLGRDSPLGEVVQSFLRTTAAIGLVIVPWRIVLGGAVFVGVLLANEWLFGPRRRETRSARFGRALGGGLAGVLALSVVVPSTPWIQRERIELHDSESTIVGYVIDADAHWVTILEDAPRRIVIARGDTVTVRTPCGTELTSKSVLALLFRAPAAEYPPCDEGELEPSDASAA
jgi:hypothetical protein